jgi:hypothetical protein
MIIQIIDRTYEFMQRLWDTSNRILLTQTVLSILTIGLSVGMLSVEEQIEIGGLKVKLAIWILVGGGAFLVGVLLMSFYTIESHAMILGDQLRTLYREAGGKLLDYPVDTIFDTPNVMVSSISFLNRPKPNRFAFLIKLDNVTTFAAVATLILLLPLAAEVLAAVKVSSSFGWKWWSWFPFVVLILGSLSSFVTFLIRNTSD